ncbi:GUCA1B [Symbiodinium microadriaticum]|nr:GUCA1B [Symbiodinium microadriaticum]CAE7907108.1 GUCA1B [Symbiodinium sp. KB8]
MLRACQPLWRALFSAIDFNGDNIIDFEEFLTFVTQLKRGGMEAKRRLCFRLFDSNQDGYAEKGDFRGILETKIAALRLGKVQLARFGIQPSLWEKPRLSSNLTASKAEP